MDKHKHGIAVLFRTLNRRVLNRVLFMIFFSMLYSMLSRMQCRVLSGCCAEVEQEVERG